ncbi:hypothetical protein HCJ13_13945 [Listeria booriae]|uniref:hypothetical protein n=1 Tax=Listeria booriae TaxID=1552123 RepID=UPI0016259486|nr:hypothetical protein [Listeria booriae]MBC1651294.1 hypothetical protein [Listeria booriae]
MEKLTKEQAEQVKIIKEYAKGQKDFSFVHLVYDVNEYYPERRATAAESIPALDIAAAISGKELTQLERAYYQGYEIEPDWKFDIGDIVYLAPSLTVPRSLWYVRCRVDSHGEAHYSLCGEYNSHAQAYHSVGGPPFMEVAEEKLTLIKKKSEWVKALAPNPPMHPRCGHGSKTQY